MQDTKSTYASTPIQCRILDPFRSSLNPMTVGGLICTQNWIRSSSTLIKLRTLMDKVEKFEKQLDMELVGEITDFVEGSNSMPIGPIPNAD
ncbi:hypothetical protein I3842_03G115100 [Carya illinoinensis]|uniref:Uncharacterized protein n=1 Tax=Carya illinoinensis TaxID=32201 RepID=A0A922JY39_CARIL|nr:hypothetical protein I3842_03G115100 [Carya illinoinensis]